MSTTALRGRIKRLEQLTAARQKIGIGERLRRAEEQLDAMTPEQRARHWTREDQTPIVGDSPLAKRLERARLRLLEHREHCQVTP